MSKGKELGGGEEGSERFNSGAGSFGYGSDWKSPKRGPVRHPFSGERFPIIGGDKPVRGPVRNPFGHDLPQVPQIPSLPRMNADPGKDFTSDGENTQKNNAEEGVADQSKLFQNDNPRGATIEPSKYIPNPPGNIPLFKAPEEYKTKYDMRLWRNSHKTKEENDAQEATFRQEVAWAKENMPTHTRTPDGMSTVEIEAEKIAADLELSAAIRTGNPETSGVTWVNMSDGAGVVLAESIDDFPLLMKIALETGRYMLAESEIDEMVEHAVAHQRIHHKKAEQVHIADPGIGESVVLSGIQFIRDAETDEVLVRPISKYYGMTTVQGVWEMQCDILECPPTPKVFSVEGTPPK